MVRCIATFDVTSMALMFEKVCRSDGLAVRVIPVPRSLSASCGLACCWPCDAEERVRELCRQHHIDVAEWHRLDE